jgi:hypothetical protein
MSVRDDMNGHLLYHAEQIGKYQRIAEVLTDLGLMDLDMYVSFHTGYWSSETHSDLGPTVELEPRHVIGLMADFQTLTDTTPTLAEAARVLLPKVGRFEKSYDGDRNEIRLTAVYKGVRVVLRDTPPDTCKVEEVVENVVVPATAERTETRRKYRLVGECEPLLAEATHG